MDDVFGTDITAGDVDYDVMDGETARMPSVCRVRLSSLGCGCAAPPVSCNLHNQSTRHVDSSLLRLASTLDYLNSGLVEN